MCYCKTNNSFLKPVGFNNIINEKVTFGNSFSDMRRL